VSFSDAEIEAAIAALSDPGRLHAAEDVVGRAAPNLQRVLGSALHEGGWFDTAHEAAVAEAAATEDPHHRLVALRTLFAEETRLTMLVGVAVGFELARELGYGASEVEVSSEGRSGRGTSSEASSDTATDRED
jgi:hypothetical protein